MKDSDIRIVCVVCAITTVAHIVCTIIQSWFILLQYYHVQSARMLMYIKNTNETGKQAIRYRYQWENKSVYLCFSQISKATFDSNGLYQEYINKSV